MIDNQWIEAHDQQLSLAMHAVRRAVSRVQLSLLRSGAVDTASLANLRQYSENLKAELDVLLRDVENAHE